MEFCPQLSALQGVIISADNTNSFSRLTSKAGNDDRYKDVINSISKFLIDGQFITPNGVVETSKAKVRKFALYIILNADLPVLSEMTNMDEIELVIWTIPTIPKCLMCEIFWQLHFDIFVYESIAYCCPELSIELASAFIDNIKYYTPFECINKLKIIGSALYRLLCRFDFFIFSNNILFEKLTIVFNNFQKTLTFFTKPPKAERLKTLNRNDEYKYIGDCLFSMLQLVDEVMFQFCVTQELNPIDDSLYMLTYICENVNWNLDYVICENPNQLIFDCVCKCNTALLDICQELVMAVSIDIFCSWSEFETNDTNMQVKIGELCYKVRNKLLSIPSVAEHPVVNMLEQISRKPIELNDVASAASIKTIIENVTNCVDNKLAWLEALIQKDQVFEDESSIQCIMSNMNILNEEKCYEIYKNLNNYITKHSENVEHLEPFIVKLFQYCNMNAKQEILKDRFSNKCFVDMAETTEFLNMMTETFNKLVISQNPSYDNVLCVFLQNPRKVYSKIFSLAAENRQQANIMTKAMTLLRDYSNHYYITDMDPCIIKITVNSLEKLDSDKTNDFINFLCILKNSEIITGTKLLLLVTMPLMHKALLNRDIGSLYTQCKLIKNTFTIEELLPYRAPVLAMIGQVLDVVRWKINTFKPTAPSTLQEALDLQISLFDSYDMEIPENECDWLKSKLGNMLPMNMYYYRQLWNPPGNNYVETITGINISIDMGSVQLITRLSQVLYSATQQEWLNAWDSLTVFDDQKRIEIFCDAFSLIAMVERMHRSEITWTCMLYCYRVFIYTVRYKYFKEPLNDMQVSSVIEKFATACKFSYDDNCEELGSTVLPLFAYLAERRGDYRFNISECLKTKLKSAKHTKFLDTISNIFTNGTN